MSEDIVARLRKLVDTEDMHPLSILAETIRDAADEIERLRGEVERLTLERDWHKSLTQSHDLLADNAALKARADAAEAKVAKLREVLLPFADIGEWSEDFFDASMASVDVALGDLRRARAVLQETETKGE